MAIAELVMPKLGESIMEATILKWHKLVGDHVKLDETVLDIATDKVDSEVPSTVEGIITEILFNVNDVVPIGTVIAKINTVATTTNIPVAAAPIAPSISEPTINPLQAIPQPTATASTVINQASAPVVIAPVSTTPVAQSTDSVTNIPYAPFAPAIELMAKPAANRFYSPLVLNIANSEGVSLSELERIPGTGNDGRVSKKDILQYVADKKAGKIPFFQQPAYAPAPPQYQQQAQQQPQQTIQQPVYVAPNEPVELVPTVTVPPTPVIEPAVAPVVSAERFAAPTPPTPVTEAVQQTIEVPVPQTIHQPIEETITQAIPTQQAIKPSTTVESVQPTIAAPVYSAPIPPSQDIVYNTAQSSGKFSNPSSVIISGQTEIIEMDRMRKLIAKHMVDSKATSPHVTSFAEADVTNMVIWREKVKKEFEQREGTKLTFTPMFVECLVKVIKRYPYVNCSLSGDQIILKKDINIGMATALPSGNLIVPVIKGADQLNIVGLSKSVNILADAARNGKLKPEDTTGGTFTLTNVGTFGSLMGTPIINQPQVAIMAVGAIKKRAVVLESPDGDTIGIRHMMYLSLSYDHRIVDGSIGASFLTAVAKEFEQWDVNKQWFHYL